MALLLNTPLWVKPGLINSSESPIHRLAFSVSSSTTLPHSSRISHLNWYCFPLVFNCTGASPHHDETTRAVFA